MYCGKCGAKNPENSMFCSECGAEIGNNNAVPVDLNTSAKNKSNRYIGIGVVVAAAALMVVVGILLFGGRSYKSVISEYIEASFGAENAGETIMDLLPEEFVEAMLDEEDMTRREAIREIEEALDSSVEMLSDLYDDWSYTYEIVEVKDFTKKKLADLKDQCEDEFEFSVSDAKTISIDITTILDAENEITSSMEVCVIKVGMSWYLWNGNIF